jgi:hypothetical protein
VDTRNANGPYGGPALIAGAVRTFTMVGPCAIPAGATSVALNVAVTGPTAAGNLALYPGGGSVPVTSALNYRAGQTRANNAIVRLGPGGSLAVFCNQATGTTHLILDVTGYFE